MSGHQIPYRIFPVRLVSGNPKPDEMAAASTVLAAKIEAVRKLPTEEQPPQSRWQQGVGPLRQRWGTGLSGWRSFGG